MCQISKYSNVSLHIYYGLNDCSPLLPTNLCVEIFTLNVIVLGSVILGKLICHELEPSWMGFSSVQFSHSIMSNSLRPHESQHTRPPCPSTTPRVHSDSRPSSQWCHPAISSSVVPSSSCPQSLPAQGFLQWVNSSHEVAKVLEFQLQHHSFQRTPRTDLL